MGNLSEKNKNLTFVPTPQSKEVAGLIKINAVSAGIPDGWLECNGSAVSRTTYSQLFAAIGTDFGVGDGSTTFNLPTISAPAANTEYVIKAYSDILGPSVGVENLTVSNDLTVSNNAIVTNDLTVSNDLKVNTITDTAGTGVPSITNRFIYQEGPISSIFNSSTTPNTQIFSTVNIPRTGKYRCNYSIQIFGGQGSTASLMRVGTKFVRAASGGAFGSATDIGMASVRTDSHSDNPGASRPVHDHSHNEILSLNANDNLFVQFMFFTAVYGNITSGSGTYAVFYVEELI